jgi:lipopolysaccharide transport system ATP-binding protein
MYSENKAVAEIENNLVETRKTDLASADIVVRVNNVSKCYEIYNSPRDRLKQFLAPPIRRLFGRSTIQYYREFWALKNISFDIRKGETVGIIGRNGSGKSTLLQIICGTLTPTSGTVETSGRVAALLELGSGFNPDFTGRENVYLNAAVLGLSRDKVEKRFDEIVRFADIGEFIDQPVKTYSSGMMVRLAFAVVVHVDADILVVDEALSVGDVFFQQKCMRFLHEFQQQGGTILFVSHDTSAVTGLCNSAVLLSREKEQQLVTGTTDEICRIYLSELYNERGLVKSADVIAADGLQSPLAESSVGSEIDGNVLDGDDLPENQLHVSQFQAKAESFGVGGMRITDVSLHDEVGNRLSHFAGGQKVTLRIEAEVLKKIAAPAFGFMLKDRLGQYIFAEGTDLSFRNRQLTVDEQQSISAEFSFLFPILIQGEYTFNVAVAEGEGHEHIQHHWIHDAVIVKSLKSRLVHGIVGVQDLNIAIRTAACKRK